MTILCTIDLLTREVFLPADQRIASYDHNVDVIRFQAEPIEDFSLDTSSIKIAAQGPNKARHDYAVDPSTVAIEEETGYITFDWPVPAGVTEMPIGSGFKYGDKGQLIFAVCAEIISGSTVSKAWHSDDGIITVVAHLEPEAGSGEDPSEEATNAQKIGQLQTDVAVINTQVGALANGSPTPVETVAEMTDESTVYLYTGSETGYTAGNWYFWNGSAWTSGGTYGGAVTDTTLSISGKPADAKKTGGEISELKEELSEKVEYLSKKSTQTDISTQISFVNENMDLDNRGNLYAADNSSVTDYIDIEGIKGIYRTGTETKYTLWGYAFYDENHTFINRAAGTTNYTIEDYDGKRVTWLTLNPNAKYVRISREDNRPYTYYVATEVESVTSYTVPNLIISGKNVYEGVVDGSEAKEICDEITEPYSLNILNPDDLQARGYYLDFSDGVTHIDKASYCLITEKIAVDGASALYVRQIYDSTSSGTVAVYYYNGDEYLGYRSARLSSIADGSTCLEMLVGKVTHIVIYTNASNQPIGDKICISHEVLDEFTPYKIEHAIKKHAIKKSTFPPIPPIDALLNGKVIANFGDSVFGNKRPPNDISTAIANNTGATVYNLGFGGCRMSKHDTNWDAFSMYRLADAVATGDYSVQNAVDVDNVSGMPSYFKETRALLESIDFSKVDIVTIAYGTNDFTASVALDNANNPKDTTTFCGALRYSLEKLLTAYPQLHIFVCTPTWRFWMDNGTFLYDSDTHEINGNLLTAFVEAVKTISKAYHVKSIDNYYDLGINQYNRSHWFPSNDGTHHNKDGGVLIAKHMITEMF